jgi:2-aminoadipate transaminase
MAISLVARSFATKGSQDEGDRPVVFLEDPTYFLAANIFTDMGITVKGFPVDQDGLRVDLVEAALKEGARPRLVYIIPSFHNPTGTNLSSERRQRMVELSVEYDFHIVSDEPYVLLNFSSEVQAPSMAKFDGAGEASRVLCLGSFSVRPNAITHSSLTHVGSLAATLISTLSQKILAPGLRLGWVTLALTSHRE